MLAATRLSTLGLVCAIIGAVAVLAAGPLHRSGWLDLRSAFTLLRWGAYGGVAGAIVSTAALVSSVRRQGRAGLVPAVAGLLIGLTAFAIPWSWQRTARQVPPIHDITTDTDTPPEFQDVLPRRADAPNSATYGGKEIADQQHRAYPDIQPLVLNVPPAQAFDRALQAAERSGWEIVATSRDQGRIEATDTTRWFGFKDDVVVRVTPAPGGSRIDVRSVSRVGRSDVGTNARRIRLYLETLRGSSS